MAKQKNYLAFGAVGLVALLMFSLPLETTNRIKQSIGSLFLPLVGVAGTAQQLPVAAADAILSRRELLQLTETLRHENDQLRSWLGRQRELPWKLKFARVILRDPANWWHTVEIDLGSRDGITNNQPVLTAEGLVGRISSVALTRSQVVLLSDPNCKASGLVENPAHDIGVISVGGPLDPSLVQLIYLSGSANLKPGQNVYTSGLGGVFPKGIPIGQVVDSRPVDFGLYTEARVKLAANLGALEQVWVLMK